MDINLNDLLRRYRAHPYEDYRVETPHTGVLSLQAQEGEVAEGPSGQWLHRPGTLLYSLERERNTKKIHAQWSGQVADIRTDLDGSFVEAGTAVMSIRHRLGREEIIDRILTEVLTMFVAPQRARYFIAPDVAAKLEKETAGGVAVQPGDEVLIMSLMKRDTFIAYDGVSGVIYKVYCRSGDMIEQGAPLMGICPPDKLQYIQKMIQRIRAEWEE